MTEPALTRLLSALAWGFLFAAVGTALALAAAAHGWLRKRAERKAGR